MSRIDDLAVLNLAKEINNKIVENDPSKNKKYILWMGKQVKAGAAVEEVIGVVQAFDKKPSIFGTTDINAIENITDDVLARARIMSDRLASKSGFVEIYDDEEFLVGRLDKWVSIKDYFAETKLCITTFATFARNYIFNSIFYLLHVKQTKNKYCIRIFSKGNYEIYDAKDNVIYDQHTSLDFINPKLVEIVKKCLEDSNNKISAHAVLPSMNYNDIIKYENYHRDVVSYYLTVKTIFTDIEVVKTAIAKNPQLTEKIVAKLSNKNKQNFINISYQIDKIILNSASLSELRKLDLTNKASISLRTKLIKKLSDNKFSGQDLINYLANNDRAIKILRSKLPALKRSNLYYSNARIKKLLLGDE